MGTGSLAQRLWAAPALAVLGIDAPPVAGAANILVPTAAAKLSMRVPAGQDPAVAAELLKDHLRAHAPFGAEVIIRDGELRSEERRVGKEDRSGWWRRYLHKSRTMILCSRQSDDRS